MKSINDETFPMVIPIVPPEFSTHFRKLGEKGKIGFVLPIFFSIVMMGLLMLRDGVSHFRGKTI